MNLCDTHQMPYCRECTRTVKAPFGSVRKPLEKKSSGSTRYIRQADYLKCIGNAVPPLLAQAVLGAVVPARMGAAA